MPFEQPSNAQNIETTSLATTVIAVTIPPGLETFIPIREYYAFTARDGAQLVVHLILIEGEELGAEIIYWEKLRDDHQIHWTKKTSNPHFFDVLCRHYERLYQLQNLPYFAVQFFAIELGVPGLNKNLSLNVRYDDDHWTKVDLLITVSPLKPGKKYDTTARLRRREFFPNPYDRFLWLWANYRSALVSDLPEEQVQQLEDRWQRIYEDATEENEDLD